MTKLKKLIPRNAALLTALLILLVVSPLVSVDGNWLLLEAMFDLILLAGVYSTGADHHRLPFLVLTMVTLGVRWGELLADVGGLDVTAQALTTIWLFYALWIIVGHLFGKKDVTVDTILGAIVAYLLAAVAFGILFQVIETEFPGSFSGLEDGASENRHELSSAMLYFSLVCITTMGYGDIVPVAPAVRPLAVLEGAFGQLYVAVMIARLVGLHLGREGNGS